jgi:spore maturation protein CgeB
MRIVIFGLSISSSWGNGHATIWRGLCNALAENGHSVVFFEKDVPYYRRTRDLASPGNYKLELYADWTDTEPLARTCIANSDCAVVTSYCPDAREAADAILATANVCSVFYDLDTPVTLNVLGRNGTVDYIPEYGLEPFDLVLSYTGGKALSELSRQLNARRVAPLYGSVDPSMHHRVPDDLRFVSDFSYLGTYAADRQNQVEQLFVRPAVSLPQRKFCLAGALYPADFPWTSNTYFVQHLAPSDHPAFYSSSKLTLNVTRGAMAEMGYCPSGRLFEAAACGTPVVSDWWEGLDHFFKPGKEILIAQTPDDVISAIGKEHDELRSLAVASQERVMAEHTAARRATEFVSLIEASA